jgi:hypothetical protein
MKGAAFERLIAREMRVIWPGARRGIGQARSASEVPDVDGTPYWVECKRMKKCNIKAAIRQAQAATDGRPILVVTKDDFGPVTVTTADRTTMTWGQFLTWASHQQSQSDSTQKKPSEPNSLNQPQEYVTCTDKTTG